MAAKKKAPSRKMSEVVDLPEGFVEIADDAVIISHKDSEGHQPSVIGKLVGWREITNDDGTTRKQPELEIEGQVRLVFVGAQAVTKLRNAMNETVFIADTGKTLALKEGRRMNLFTVAVLA